jgi:E3 ubiquitin-protein ligase RNF14
LALLDFDLTTKRERFEKETFDCGICLEPKKGVNCHKLLQCGHVFCVSCLQDFYKSCIAEGDVDSVKCLSPTCGKDQADGHPPKRRKQDRTLNPSELLQIPIEPDLVQRYVRLKRKKRLEADKNTIYCPRQWCQGAARSKKHPKPTDALELVDENSDSEEEDGARKKVADPEALPMSERLSVCEDCGFAFCCVCGKGWHGELQRCSPRRQQELNEEEAATAAYIQKHSTPCPTCNAPAQKSMGCNHMICFKCKTHFCYLCSAYLMPDNPYSHFNDVDSECYQRLWVLEGGDFDGAPAHFQDIHDNPELADWDAREESDSDDEADLPPENFDAFQGDRPWLADQNENEDDSTDDEEPAPDQRRPQRNMHIEIVNFAHPGAQNPQRIALPERPREAAVAPAAAAAPAPPNPGARRQQPRRGGGQQANRLRAMRNEPARGGLVRDHEPNRPQQRRQQAAHNNVQRAEAGGQIIPGPAPAPEVPLPADHDNAPVDHDPPLLPLAAPGQGNNHPAAAGPVRAMGGLERFLELARHDLEDEWDSDELDDDEDGHHGLDEFEIEPLRGARRGNGINWRQF